MKKCAFLLLLVAAMAMTGCGEKQSNNQPAASARPETNVQEENVVASVIPEEGVTHFVSSGLSANDCSSYKKMEKQSNLIVLGTKKSESLKYAVEEDYDLMADIEITDVIKADDGISCKAGDTIRVQEDIMYSKSDKAVYHIGGYEKMEIGSNYYLMLGYNEESDIYYAIGGIYGKIPEDPSEDYLIDSTDISSEERQTAAAWIDRNREHLKE